ncbi:hypothetical protein KMZ32_02295 [Phycicoccus sp. MAQZ13P-2]|uniref:hypothetical protein n=1 Tax=Phycicoccus mangrovi TaxID=2840470 RepID=UPI001C0060C6|nr:hypothetical protein [Phycicoccus mangrovi]MBT9257898.1 hypothetical protein [Phycicoccus mangrovi]MBT9272901.1 hypothetical protein [Phycicoccus mangrovi]
MGTTRRQLVVMVTGWVLVVLVVGGATFAVVSRAGDEVGQASALRSVAAAVPEPSASRSDRPSRTTASDPPTPDGSEEPEPSEDPSAQPSSSAPASTPTRTSTPARTPSPAGTTSPPRPPAPQTRTASFTTVAGTVVASCTGSTVRRESITARDGWRFEDQVERGRLEVHFARAGGEGSEDEPGETEGDADDEVELAVVCVDGAPTRRSH